MVIKRILLQYTMKFPISVFQQWLHSFEIDCKKILIVILCYLEINFAIFLGNVPKTLVNMPFGDQALSGGHVSVGTTQQSQRLALMGRGQLGKLATFAR